MNWAGGPIGSREGEEGRYNNARTDRWDANVSLMWGWVEGGMLHGADVKLEDLLST